MDPVDKIIVSNSPEAAHNILVIDAPELVPAAAERAGKVIVFCDDIRDTDRARELAAPGVWVVDGLDDLNADSLADVDLAWLRLPKALGALDQYAQRISAYASDEVMVIAGGRDRHMNRSMNEVLNSHFGGVSATLGRQKSRALRAITPFRSQIDWPRYKRHSEVNVAGRKKPLTLWANGATFATNKVDNGTRLMLGRLGQIADADTYLDLGCGNGILATSLAKMHPDSQIFAIDASWAGVDATRRTASTAKARVDVRWAADLSGFEDSSIDVIVTNPPFHKGIAKESEPTLELFKQAARVLGEGGEFWCVFNSHLPWKAALTKRIGPTDVMEQNTGYTLTRSVKPNS
ncbi:class I SAM-dependent methyltransferase [Propionimicrobium lymphophilum]|uniref:class I SAM-dependent methyltransferase n=1 Tax=Propionimicrobium lymphophilum TaxID=33012 RepID=UPI00288B36BF|nr:methyltransferase [Propionimicrobium lymphophilum]